MSGSLQPYGGIGGEFPPVRCSWLPAARGSRRIAGHRPGRYPSVPSAPKEPRWVSRPPSRWRIPQASMPSSRCSSRRAARVLRDPAPPVRADPPAPRGRRHLRPTDRGPARVDQRLRHPGYPLQDLRDAQLQVGIFGATLTVTADPGEDLAGAHGQRPRSFGGLRKEQAQEVYRACQSQEQSWREKRRVRELEEMRAKSGGVHLGACRGCRPERGMWRARPRPASSAPGRCWTMGSSPTPNTSR